LQKANEKLAQIDPKPKAIGPEKHVGGDSSGAVIAQTPQPVRAMEGRLSRYWGYELPTGQRHKSIWHNFKAL